jgi:hypothetical protein
MLINPADPGQGSWPMSLPATAQHMTSHDLDGSFTVPDYNSHLAPPGPRTSLDNGNMYSMNNLYDDGPWSALGMRTSGRNVSSNRHVSSGISYRGFVSGPGSDVSSTALRSDSGYLTQPTGSVLSHEPERRDQELPTEITRKVSSMNVGSVTSEPPEMKRMPSDQRSVSQFSIRSTSRSKTLPCPVEGCGAVMKCPSDLKYLHDCSLLIYKFTKCG